MWRVLELLFGALATILPLALIWSLLQVYDDLLLQFGVYSWIYVSLVGHVFLTAIILTLTWARRFAARRTGSTDAQIERRRHLVDMTCALFILALGYVLHRKIGFSMTVITGFAIGFSYMLSDTLFAQRNWQVLRLVLAGTAGWTTVQMSVFLMMIGQTTPGGAIIAAFLTIWLALIFLFRWETVFPK